MAKPIPFKTPLGNISWVVISGEGKENLSGKQQYVADLILADDSDACAQLKAKIDSFWKENKPASHKRKAKSLGYRPELEKVLDENGQETYDEDGEVIKRETGNTVFHFATATTYPNSGDTKVVSVFNAKGNKVNLGTKKIGNGSQGRIGGAMGVYAVTDKSGKILDAGVTLYLNSIQLTKFVEFTSDDNWDAIDGEDGWTGEDNWDSEPDGEAETDTSDKPAPRL